MRGISRFDYNRSYGYLARYYTQEGVIQRLFSDSRYYGVESTDGARVAAQRWLADLARTVEPRPRFRQTSKRTKTGQVGVCLTYARGRTGKKYWLYSVSYRLDGKRHTKTFRVHHYPSKRAAFEAAVAFRQAMERQMQCERQQDLQRLFEGEDNEKTARQTPLGEGRQGRTACTL